MKRKNDWRERLMREDWKIRGYVARGFAIFLLLIGIVNLVNNRFRGDEVSIIFIVLAVILWLISYIFLPFKKN
ncbi:hypothetical protein HY500_00330 [Candidatus Woesearchaeota archaeon]|nr:hypothetical protein [Candidatus Woesearchaeota archaeon]